jgi:hypothetical protein
LAYLGDDVGQPRFRRQRISRNGDIDATREGAAREKREPHLAASDSFQLPSDCVNVPGPSVLLFQIKAAKGLMNEGSKICAEQSPKSPFVAALGTALAVFGLTVVVAVWAGAWFDRDADGGRISKRRT